MLIYWCFSWEKSGGTTEGSEQMRAWDSNKVKEDDKDLNWNYKKKQIQLKDVGLIPPAFRVVTGATFVSEGHSSRLEFGNPGPY